MQSDSVSPFSKNSKEAVKLRQHKEIAPRENTELKVEESVMTIPPHSRMHNVESEESDESEEEIVNSTHGRTDDPEWTPGSSYQQRKLQSNNTADDIAYRLRSRLVSRSEREMEVDKECIETNRLSESEHMEVNTQNNRSPNQNKSAMSHSYNLRSRIGTTSSKMQK